MRMVKPHDGKLLAGIMVLALSATLALYSGLVSAYSSGEFGSGTYGSCEYGVTCSISLTSNGSISLNITPTSSGACTINSDSASVLTDDSNGYTLTLADISTSTALTNVAATIATTSGTVSSPTSLSGNSWGYRVDSLGGFGSGPTTSQSNISRPSTTFAGIVASDQTADTIATTSGAADPAVSTTVWYGACADTTASAGAYTTTVLYTAVSN